MSLLKKYKSDYGYQKVVAEGESGLKKARFDTLKLKTDSSYADDTGSNESTFVILSGTCSFVGDNFRFEHIGIRKDVFSGKPAAVYLPCHTPYKITAETEVEIGICSAGSTLKSAPVLISPDDVTEINLGVLNWTRKAYFIIDQRVKSEYLFIGETLIPAGNWAFPPHRHDHDNLPVEVDMDEIYHFRINPPTGFGLQVSYTDDQSRDDAYLLRNGDTTILPDGYHPVGTSPVDSLYLLWMMAGEKRIFLSRPDDNYSWVLKCENLLKQKK